MFRADILADGVIGWGCATLLRVGVVRGVFFITGEVVTPTDIVEG